MPQMSPDDQDRIGLVAGQAFTPASSIRQKDVFAGRRRQIRQVIDAINQHGSSVLIYGERGVGKTSLANVIDEFYVAATPQRIFGPHIACDPEDNFDSVWRKLLAEKDRRRPSVTLSDQILQEIDQVLDDCPQLGPHAIRSVADVIAQTHLFIPIIDEFDRLEDEDTVRLFTDTIKYISDHCDNTTIIMVGVGDTVDDLVREHESIERALVQVPMPRMSPQESREILENGARITGVRFTDEAMGLIVGLSQGLPYYTHKLGLNATRAAVDRGQWSVDETDVETAMVNSITDSEQSLRRLYHTATSSPRPDSLFRQALLACALAPTDSLGYFAPADVREPMSKIMGERYEIARYSQHLNQFASEDRNFILEKIGDKRKWRYRFRNPMIQPFIIMQGISDKMIGRSDLDGVFRSRSS